MASPAPEPEGASRGRLIVVSGPSGVGKSTLARRARERRPDLVLTVSATTRAPRPGEIDGRDYRFVDRERFERLREAGALLEWAEVHGALYGTPREPVEEALAAGRSVLLEIDVQGARQVKAAEARAVRVFVEPPSWEVLEARLRGRGTEDPEALRRRLETARAEMATAREFEERLVNDSLDDAANRLLAIIDSS